VQRPQLSCPPTQWLHEPTPTVRTEGEQRPQHSCSPKQWLADPTPFSRTEARAAPSPVVPDSRVAGCAHAEKSNRHKRSALNSRAHNHRDWLSPGLPSEQRPEQRRHLSCPPRQWLPGPTTTDLTEGRPEPSPVTSPP
jgi:hypothetical protein